MTTCIDVMTVQGNVKYAAALLPSIRRTKRGSNCVEAMEKRYPIYRPPAYCTISLGTKSACGSTFSRTCSGSNFRKISKLTGMREMNKGTSQEMKIPYSGNGFANAM